MHECTSVVIRAFEKKYNHQTYTSVFTTSILVTIEKRIGLHTLLRNITSLAIIIDKTTLEEFNFKGGAVEKSTPAQTRTPNLCLLMHAR